MRLALIGLNHHTAPLDVREGAALAPSAVQDALDRLRPLLHEGVLLSTCNRTELYAVPQEGSDLTASFQQALPHGLRIEPRHLFTSEGGDAVRHLFRVASGVDSLVFGENEVLGQVRRASEAARGSGTVGALTSRLFQMALAVGKRVRTRTAIGRYPASASTAAVSLAERHLTRELAEATVLVIGTGVVGHGVARTLHKRGAGTLMIANHRPKRALEAAERFAGIAIPWPIPTSYLAMTDVIISSTAAPEAVLRVDDVKEAAAMRPGGSIHVIDLAVPRDVDPDVASLPNVMLHNLDDIETVVAESIERRRETRPQAEKLVAEQAARFERWLRERDVVPTIKHLRSDTEALRLAELEWALPKLSSLSGRERDVLDMLTSRLVNKMLHAPSTRLRLAAGDGETDEYRRVAEDLFGLNGATEATDRPDRDGSYGG